MGWILLSAALCFFLVCFNLFEAAKTLTIVLTILSFAVCAAKFQVLRHNFSLPMLLVTLIVLLGGISLFYAVWGDYATYSASHLAASLCGVYLLVAIFGDRTDSGSKIAGVLACCTALLSFFSIDFISTRIFSTPLMKLLGACKVLDTTGIGVEPGVRITSIFNNPNVFAGCVGLGVLLSLGLSVAETDRKKRRLYLCCLYLNALAFVLTFSMGATAAIVVAFVIYLLLERKERRSDLAVLMVEAFVLVLLGVVPISATSFDAWSGFQPVPLLCAVGGSALLCVADTFVGCRVAEKLRSHGKLLFWCIAGLLVIAVVFGLVACLWTSEVSLSKGEYLRRAVYPESGQYTVSAVGGENVSVTVEAQNYQQTMMHTSTVLYQGVLEGASFSVPQDTEVVYLNFAATEDALLERVSLTAGETAIFVPLDYKLLPGFISNRLQGLLANQNAIQRTVFFNDGLKLFAQSPITGLGLGAFEMAYSSVQEFYYETKYVHNHYIETLLETGVIGFTLFVSLLVVSAVMVLKACRKKEAQHPMVPALGGLVIYMAIHAGVEVVFSYGCYLPIAFGIFAVIGICCRDALKVKWLTKKVSATALSVTAAALVVFSIMLGQNLKARNLVQNVPTFDSLETAIQTDKLNWKAHANSYIASVTGQEVPEENRVRAQELAEKLDKTDSRWINFRLAHYYLSLGQVEKAMEKAEKHIRYNASNSERWNELYGLLISYEQQGTPFVDGVSRIAGFMQQWDAENMGEITLSDASKEFLSRVVKN